MGDLLKVTQGVGGQRVGGIGMSMFERYSLSARCFR
jgi:hypothetical protein